MADKLFINSEKEYGNDYKNHFLEQYKMYLESIEKTSDRRQSANNYFLETFARTDTQKFVKMI